MKKTILLSLVLLSLFCNAAHARYKFYEADHTDVWNNPEHFQIRMDYLGQTDGNPAYIGFSRKGAASSDDNWIIYKLTYDGSRQLTLRQIAFGVWDDRTTLTYE